MSPEKCRAARAWLGWSQRELAVKAQVSNSTLRDWEAGRRVPHRNNLAAIRIALETAGMQFHPDCICRQEQPPPKPPNKPKKKRRR